MTVQDLFWLKVHPCFPYFQVLEEARIFEAFLTSFLAALRRCLPSLPESVAYRAARMAISSPSWPMRSPPSSRTTWFPARCSPPTSSDSRPPPRLRVRTSPLRLSTEASCSTAAPTSPPPMSRPQTVSST